MKIVHGWHLPDYDTHFEAYFEALHQAGKPCEYQQQQREAALAFVKKQRVAVDIGCHVGLWSRPLAAIFQQVVGFEPLALFHQCYKLNAPTARLEPYALGDSDDVVDIVLPNNNTGMAHVVPDSEGSGSLRMYRLDDFQLVNVDLIKIDCEGYEYPILLGASDTINSSRPVVVVEQKPHAYFEKYWGQYAAMEYMLDVLNYKIGKRVIDDWVLVPQ
ncbi:MAG: FkbM family methyltransferase [Hydrogenophilales bacterium]|nr:FkbM family methyltransferase [Hydrogenophilales bacterium]